MKFKELKRGERFEFESVFIGMASGPWIKRSARTYYKDTSPFGSSWAERMEHAELSGEYNEVGTINVAVQVLV